MKKTKKKSKVNATEILIMRKDGSSFIYKEVGNGHKIRNYIIEDHDFEYECLNPLLFQVFLALNLRDGDLLEVGRL